MICCQNGAQDAVLLEIADQGWRRAYSRGGFVTVKHDQTTEHLPQGVFVRSAAWTIGSVKGIDGKQLIADGVSLVKATERKFDQIHVWPRDRVPIGKFDFEPGPDELTRAIASELATAMSAEDVCPQEPNRVATAGQSVLDVVIVGPAEWWIGWHSVHPALAKKSAGNLLPTAWPGGVQPIEPEGDVISRAYFKAAEAIAWSGFDMKPGDRCVEVGSSPGGACKRLLELGLSVVGIDPAEMDIQILEHPHFRHIRARAGDLPRKEFRGMRWLMVDSNVRPDQSLTTVENIVTSRESTIEGMLLTLKLGGFEHADRIAAWVNRMRTWGATDIRVRNLARGKVEVCVAARMKRRG